MERKKIIRRGIKNPKAKGSKYERHVCKRLSLWVSKMKRTDVFWRSASSGGRFTQSVNNHKRRGREGIAGLMDAAHAGDIALTHESGASFIQNFVVECKHRQEKDLKLINLIFGRRGGVTGMWSKLLTECTGARMPMLICRQNCQPEVVILNDEGYRLIRSGGKLPVTCRFPDTDMVIVLLRDVLTTNFEVVKRNADIRTSAI